MTVEQLIEKLQEEDPEAEVYFAYGSGDYWRTILAKKVTRMDEKPIQYSAYHEMNKVVEDEADFDDATTPLVLVLS
jgi:hypothetical protein